MIVITITESPRNPNISQKKFLCEHCGKIATYCSLMPSTCDEPHCRMPLPNIKALMQMPSTRISWHKGTTNLLCYP